MSKTYDDDQRHPSGVSSNDAIPDTHDHADVVLTIRGPGCGETHYVPGDGFLVSHGGFSNESKAGIYDKKVKKIRKARRDTAKRKLPQGGTYLSEEEVLQYAAAIHAHRKMTGAKGAKERRFEEARARTHKGTDAEDAATGFHKQSDNFDIDKSRSTIRIGMTSIGSPGVALNGSKVYHQHAVSISISSPDGRQLCEIMLSPEQFAMALVGNAHAPCTVSRYWSSSEDSVMLTERVRPPESVLKRMEKRLKHRLSEQSDALDVLAQEIMDQAESGKPARKTLLSEFAKRIKRAAGDSVSSTAFTVGQAREEVTSIVEAAGIQFLGQQGIDAEALWAVAGPALGMGEGAKLLEDHEEEA